MVAPEWSCSATYCSSDEPTPTFCIKAVDGNMKPLGVFSLFFADLDGNQATVSIGMNFQKTYKLLLMLSSPSDWTTMVLYFLTSASLFCLKLILNVAQVSERKEQRLWFGTAQQKNF